EREDVRRALAEVEHRVAPVRAGEAAVAHLLEADREHDVVHAGGDGEAGVPERIHAGGAVVLDAGHGAAEELQGIGQRVAPEGRHDRPDPRRLNSVPLTPCVGERLAHGVAHEVLGALVVELAELRTADAHDGDLLAQLDRHADSLRADRLLYSEAPNGVATAALAVL